MLTEKDVDAILDIAEEEITELAATIDAGVHPSRTMIVLGDVHSALDKIEHIIEPCTPEQASRAMTLVNQAVTALEKMKG